MNDRWLSVAEICTYLGIKRDTVYKWISEKDMPAHMQGVLWNFKVNEKLENYFKDSIQKGREKLQ